MIFSFLFSFLNDGAPQCSGGPNRPEGIKRCRAKIETTTPGRPLSRDFRIMKQRLCNYENLLIIFHFSGIIIIIIIGEYHFSGFKILHFLYPKNMKHIYMAANSIPFFFFFLPFLLLIFNYLPRRTSNSFQMFS